MVSNKPVDYENLIVILAFGAVFTLVYAATQIALRAPINERSFALATVVPGYERPQAPKHLHGGMGAVPPMPNTKPTLKPKDAALIKERFEQAVALMHAKQYEYAITALNQILDLQPDIPEVYVNLGFSYLDMGQNDTALGAFTKATDLRPGQANAYFGLAMALDGKKDYEGALGAMRAYIHLSKPDDPWLAKARSAIWEWEGQLGRIPGVTEVPDGAAKSELTQKASPHQKRPGPE